jgi:pimeloyl-ACP methyl ester carboxylesterase
MFQRQLVYFPTRQTEPEALKAAEELRLVPWRNPRGELIGWRAPNPAARAKMLVFHGNGGSAQDRAYYASLFSAPLKESRRAGASWELTILEYPGYGARAGSPGEKAFKEAAGEAFRQMQGEDSRPVVLLGESLGSGVACAVAAENDAAVSALLLVTPFTSLPDVASHHYPFFPVGTLLRDRYDNLGALGKYHGPLAVALAARDEVVPARLGQRLFDSYSGPKRLWVVPEATHNGVMNRISGAVLEEIRGFLLGAKSRPSKSNP